MVSTRQMATSVGGGGSIGSIDEPTPSTSQVTRLSVVTRQTSGNGGGGSRFATVKNGNNSPSRNAVENISSPELNLLDMPLEILNTIVSYMDYKRVGQLRLVSQTFNKVCMHILNNAFSKVLTQTFNDFHAIKANMPRRESARRTHPLACECDIIETCYMRLSLLQMTFGKHIERGHCCFFPGAILDEVYVILNSIRNTPELEGPYRVTDELFDLSTMAMEYFKDRIEPTLPGIGFFNKNYYNCPPTTKRPLVIATDLSDSPSAMPSPPQSNMVLRKGIRKIKQGMKIYSNQLAVLRNELRTCKRKSVDHGKLLAEQQKLLTDQQKQTVEYANRLDENDKKNEEMARKFSTLLQELNKCKTELQYWRSKSPAIPTCTSCGQKVAPVLPTDDIVLFLNTETDSENDHTATNGTGVGDGAAIVPDELTIPDEMEKSMIAAKQSSKRQHGQATAAGSPYDDQSVVISVDCIECNGVDRRNANAIEKLSDDNESEHVIMRDAHPLMIMAAETVAQQSPTITLSNKDLSGVAISESDNNKCQIVSLPTTAFAVCTLSSTGAGIGDDSVQCYDGTGNSQQQQSKQFYGNSTNMHKSVIVSPSMWARVNQSQLAVLEDSSTSSLPHCSTAMSAIMYEGNNSSGSIRDAIMVDDNKITNVAAATNEDVVSLQAIKSHETRKARRVQKAARCSAIGPGGAAIKRSKQ